VSFKGSRVPVKVPRGPVGPAAPVAPPSLTAREVCTQEVADFFSQPGKMQEAGRPLAGLTSLQCCSRPSDPFTPPPPKNTKNTNKNATMDCVFEGHLLSGRSSVHTPPKNKIAQRCVIFVSDNLRPLGHPLTACSNGGISVRSVTCRKHYASYVEHLGHDPTWPYDPYPMT